MIQSPKYNILIYFSLAILFVLFAVFYSRFYVVPKNFEKISRNFQSVFLEKEKSLDGLLDGIVKKIDANSKDTIFLIEKEIDGFSEKGISIILFENGIMNYWSENSIPVFELLDENGFEANLIFLTNGWYYTKKIEINDYSIVGLIKIKSEFAYENQYLINDFQKDFTLPTDVSINLEKSKFHINDSNGDFLFSLDFPSEIKTSESQLIFLTIIYLIALILIIVTIYWAYIQLDLKLYKKRYLLLFAFIIDVLLIRIGIFYFEIPRLIYSSKLFSPEVLAYSTIIPSLGDLLINCIILLSVSFVIYKSLNINTFLLKKAFRKKYIVSAGLISVIFIFYISMAHLFQNIIVNSSISFNLNDITSIDAYSVFGFICFGLLIISFVFLTFKLSLIISRILSRPLQFFTFIFLSHILFYFICQYFFKCDSIILIFLLIYISSFWVINKSTAINIRFSSTVFYIVLFSLFSTLILYQTNQRNEKENRKIIAQKLALQRDPVAEYLFEKITQEIEQDSALQNLLYEYSSINDADPERIISHINRNYFSNYWKNYDLLITICDSSKLLDIQPEDYLINCFDYFKSTIDENGIATESENLYYLDYDFTSDNYLGIIDLKINEAPLKIIIEFFTKYVPKGLGYPELLIDHETHKSSEWSKYSWAIYENGELAYHFGKFFYSMNISDYGVPSNESSFFNLNKHNHLYYPIDKDTMLVISKRNPNLLDIVAPFSYIFIFFGIMLLIVLLILRSPIDIKPFELNFKKRLQLSIISLIVISFLLIGIGTLYYIISLNDSKNHDILSEKSHSVLIELEHKLAAEETLSPELEQYMSDLLYKFSLVFFSDINLYDLNGTLLATSRAEIFNQGLISTKMNTEAYNHMSNLRKSLFIHEESIGEYEYLSAYLPFRNEQNNLIAYLNLPYFAKQDELTNEISTYLVAFVNIYVILIAVAIFIALVISNYITKPIQLLKDKISRLKLGKRNEIIEWTKKDEIGSLVMEYNRMVDELADSAERLAKSERESAWREMAKQIAHEIKNPLTPMKLSVQYLQKAWDEKAPDWDNRLKRFTQTIVEQIDSLSTIASEFSDFAKMPRLKFEKTDITEVIRNSIGLFRNTTKIQFKFDYSKKYYSLADKEQLLRVFNNLIKNSIQAISDPEKGLIEISIEEDNKYLILKFTDNGNGIPKDQREKVFYPNFTTKSSGLGLGLAMVKSIVQNTGGEITFESEEGVGTTFIIALPVYTVDN
ncbi:MAG: HAMP domain-containing histidine kinase [Bacteroidales bacterium]|nr:HAMP domain-containing histidine kinase [Bacteroidales bacterium]